MRRIKDFVQRLWNEDATGPIVIAVGLPLLFYGGMNNQPWFAWVGLVIFVLGMACFDKVFRENRLGN